MNNEQYKQAEKQVNSVILEAINKICSATDDNIIIGLFCAKRQHIELEVLCTKHLEQIKKIYSALDDSDKEEVLHNVKYKLAWISGTMEQEIRYMPNLVYPMINLLAMIEVSEIMQYRFKKATSN